MDNNNDYNPDAQYGFPTGGEPDAPGGGNAPGPYGDVRPGGYNLNGQRYTTEGEAQQKPSGGWNDSGQPSGGYSYGDGSFRMNNGGPPLDGRGRPMKNSFEMKLTFSIIEMVVGLALTLMRSWCFGLIPLILAAVACVMVCMQNKHYKEGNWSSFVSAKRASAALLWVAFGFDVVFLVLIVVAVILLLVAGAGYLGALGSEMGLDALLDLDSRYENRDVEEAIGGNEKLPEFYDEDDYGDYDDSYDYGSDEYSTIDGENLYIDGFNEFKLNGSRLSLPVYMEDFYKAGFLMNEEDMEDVIPEGSYDGYAYFDTNGNYLGTVFVYNVTNGEIRVEEGIAAGITVNRYEDVSLALVNGITFDTPADEAVAALGNPTGISGSESMICLEWYMNGRYGSSLELDYQDQELTEVWIMNDLVLENR